MQPSNEARARGRAASTSSSFTTMSSSISSCGDVGRLDLLLNIESLCTLFQDVAPTEEPMSTQQPDLLRIQYSKDFDRVMGLYRTLRGTFSGAFRAAPSARWFLLTAFVLRQCHSHYTAWKDRRDVVLDSARLLGSTRESLLAEMGGSDEFHGGNNIRCGELTPILESWLPLEANLKGPTGSFSVWRAVRWEFQAVEDFNLRNHKNFQVWHHRKELLLEALARTESPSHTSLLASMELFNRYLIQHHNICFADIDERAICGEVFKIDHKNYHVWLHRSWFVHTFPFLIQPPSWPALLGDYTTMTDQAGKSTEPLRAFVVQEMWEEECQGPPIPPCGLKDELDYTATLIRDDCLNNSAWCHRFYLFDRDLIRASLQTCSLQSLEDVDTVLRHLCLDEMHYALQWCVYEPCNESSFVHARGIATIYQAAALRLYLSSNATGAYNYLADKVSISSMAPLPSHYMCLKEKVPWDVFLGTFSLVQQQLCVLRDDVTSHAEELRRSVSAGDEATLLESFLCRSQYLLDNVHQVYAARYHLLFVLLEQLWCCYFTDAERDQVNETLPPKKYAEGDEAAAEAITKQPLDNCVRYFLEHEVQAMGLARRLVVEDAIRSKYWKHEINLVMHRDYSWH
ncbi:putative protein farnesyltransferase alpha subunit [Trypanosoma rangeli]|uniref:Protein farnesyltransferase/geranylgeranyltransferase type-1 subunit alpha n=1 Tax=Trypanosoma rangeli TaxID=5698 RepID=A0A422NNG1_TRYRA|nr:putative protein farnesyltransferase alpha subunit [Trypanosoma rangeli]RNF07001.1 putative protein farnesyltransferase alpha subunit [Trypanosoma rangeli]|eukprot:RNF07001.1 putative protein farnesyltransferase alpha subunit [Trypanosoma rangeli]